MTKTQTLEKPKGPTLEEMVMQTSYQERDNAMAEVRAGIERILHPRATSAHGGMAHFLPIPSPPLTSISRSGRPEPAEEKERAKFQAAMAEVATRERELDTLAQKANHTFSTLHEWAVSLGKTEDRLLISVLDEIDSPEVEAYVRQHQRFLRTCRRWADRLAF